MIIAPRFQTLGRHTILGVILGTTFGAILDTILGTILGAILDTILGVILGTILGAILDTILGVILGTILGAILDTILGEISDTILLLFKILCTILLHNLDDTAHNTMQCRNDHLSVRSNLPVMLCCPHNAVKILLTILL